MQKPSGLSLNFGNIYVSLNTTDNWRRHGKGGQSLHHVGIPTLIKPYCLTLTDIFSCCIKVEILHSLTYSHSHKEVISIWCSKIQHGDKLLRHYNGCSIPYTVSNIIGNTMLFI